MIGFYNLSNLTVESDNDLLQPKDAKVIVKVRLGTSTATSKTVCTNNTIWEAILETNIQNAQRYCFGDNRVR